MEHLVGTAYTHGHVGFRSALSFVVTLMVEGNAMYLTLNVCDTLTDFKSDWNHCHEESQACIRVSDQEGQV